MFRRAFITLTMLVTFPALASAWYVNAKTSTTGQGTITPTGNTYYANGSASGEYAVAPAAGYSVSRVTLDGVAISPNGNGKYVAPYVSTKTWRYMVAYFAAAKFNITTSVTGSGAIREDTYESLTNIPAGAARQLLIIPSPGYQVDSVTADGATVTDNADGSKTAVYTNLQANQSVSASFSLVPVFSVNAGRDLALAGTGTTFTANLVGEASSNQGAITYAWTSTPSGLVFATPNAASTLVYSNSANTYTATLTATSNGVSITDTAIITVQDGKAYYLNQCNSCHKAANTVQAVADYVAGKHYEASGHTTGTCQRCHATEGAITAANVGWTGSYATLMANQAAIWTPNAPAGSANGISCSVCHDPHGQLRQINTFDGTAVVAWNPNGNAGNDQFDVCTSCHTLLDNSGALVGNYHDGGSINTTRTISDSHYDDPATGVGLTSTTIEGYVVRKNGANPCADCHNLHTADLTIQEQWAASAHAGKISTTKDEAACTESVNWFNTTYPTNTAAACTDVKTVGTSTRTVLEFFQRNAAGIAFYKTVGVTGTSGPAWEHYNWDQTTSRGACQRCHTATGIANFLTDPAAYDATGNGNDFSHLSGWSKSTGSPQNELLYCWGCHSDSQTGTLRNPGAITETYAAATAGSPTATVAYPNINQSNVCMGCHLGREIGQNVANDIDADGVRGFINSHYLTAGSTIFNKSGYEFAGQDYSSFGFHKNVGVANTYNTGTTGPCVACHMSGAESHTFEVSADSSVCANCHSGLTTAALEASKEQFHLAMEELRLALEAKGIYFQTRNPYFFVGPGSTDASFTNWAGVYGLANWKNVMGAAFNYNVFEHDPGAYAHNRQYALKLIQDSIDFLADGALDGQGISAAFTTAANNKEFAEATSHPAAITAAADATSCAACHQPAPHYGGAYNGGNAQFVANNASCTDCHANGNVSANQAILVQYAESGHGDVAGAAWKTSSSHDWPNATTCRDCHSTTGFTAKVGGTARTTVVAGAGQTLACDACHTSVETGEVRPVGQVTGYYKSRTFNTSTNSWNPADYAVFPNVAAQNNVCIQCHAGRESGESVLALTDASMSNTSFKNPHYLGAAGMMYAKLAFVDFIDRDTIIGTSTYGKSVTANEDGGLLTSTHRKLGTSAINGDSHNAAFFVAGNLDSDGPCVTCHMGGTTAGVDAADHTWEIKQVALDQVCSKCHSAEASDLASLELFLEEQAIPFQDAVALAQAKLLANFNISYSDAYPYFYDNNLAPAAAAKDWTRGGTLSAADAKKLMGACLNIKLMKADPAAYVHSRTYARRVLYDTIDWLDDMTINMSVSATAVAWDPVKYVIGPDANAPSTESTLYLKGYNRTSKAWNALERP